jgi:hypothetical protein
MQASTRIIKVSESAARFFPRRLGAHPSALEIGRAHRDMTLDLEIHLGVDPRISAEPQVEQAAVAHQRVASERIDVTDFVYRSHVSDSVRRR